MLPINLINQIEQELYKNMSSQSKLFEFLRLKSLRRIKKDSKVSDNSLILRKGSEMNSIYIVLKGKISIYDSGMKFVNEYNEGEILGLKCFYTLIYSKYKIRVDDHFNTENYETGKDLHKKF